MSEIINHSKLARNWLLGAGTFAVLFVSFLVWADHYLTTSQGEKEQNKVMAEIRNAQTSLPSRVTDERQTVSH